MLSMKFGTVQISQVILQILPLLPSGEVFLLHKV